MARRKSSAWKEFQAKLAGCTMLRVSMQCSLLYGKDSNRSQAKDMSRRSKPRVKRSRIAPSHLHGEV
jgi:hypothetical protein